jgi:hypothetical protein
MIGLLALHGTFDAAMMGILSTNRPRGPMLKALRCSLGVLTATGKVSVPPSVQFTFFLKICSVYFYQALSSSPSWCLKLRAMKKSRWWVTDILKVEFARIWHNLSLLHKDPDVYITNASLEEDNRSYAPNVPLSSAGFSNKLFHHSETTSISSSIYRGLIENGRR